MFVIEARFAWQALGVIVLRREGAVGALHVEIIFGQARFGKLGALFWRS